MKSDAFEAYLNERYENQIQWYSDRADAEKLRYHVFQWEVIILSACLPVLVASLPKEYNWIAVIVSMLLAVGTVSLKTFKFQENWINYRKISETLKKEKYCYAASAGDYSAVVDKNALFVEKVEFILSTESNLWIDTHKQHDDMTLQAKISKSDAPMGQRCT